MVTLKDIAKSLHLSVTTVSRVLSDDKTLKVSAQTRRAVLAEAARQGYTPRRKKKTRRLVGVISWLEQSAELADPYFMEIRHGIEQLAHSQGVFIMTLYRGPSGYAIEKLTGVDGLIAIGRFTHDDIRLFEKVSRNIVFVDTAPDSLKYDAVVLDYRQSVEAVLEHLTSWYAAAIGFVGGVETDVFRPWPEEPRAYYFEKMLRQANMFEPRHKHLVGFSLEAGYAWMKTMLETKQPLARAYFCANDSIAIGVLKALQEAHIPVPESVALVGFNDIAQATYTHPSLSTLKVPTEAMGEEALRSLLNRLDQVGWLPIKKTMPTRLVVRASS